MIKDAKDKVIAVDFDGTLCTSRFPTIIAPKLETIEEVKELKRQGAILILWTCRVGEDLTNAITFCNKHDLHFDYINENTDDSKAMWNNDTRKVSANYYIDDKAINPIMEEELRQAKDTIEQLKKALKTTVNLL